MNDNYVLNWKEPSIEWLHPLINKDFKNFQNTILVSYIKIYKDQNLEKSLTELKRIYPSSKNINKLIYSFTSNYLKDSKEILIQYIIQNSEKFIGKNNSRISFNISSYVFELLFKEIIKENKFKSSYINGKIEITIPAFIDIFSKYVPNLKENIYESLKQKQHIKSVLTSYLTDKNQKASKKIKDWFSSHSEQISEIVLESILLTLKVANECL